MTAPKHANGVDLLKLIIRAKDPFPPRFYCHICKKKFDVHMNSTSPRTTKCTTCSSDFIEWVLPEDPHKRAARLRDAAAWAELASTPSPSPPPLPSPTPSPPPPDSTSSKPEEEESSSKPEDMDDSLKPEARQESTKPERMEESSKPEVTEEEKEEPMETESVQTTSEEKPVESVEDSGNGEKKEQPEPPPEPMEQEETKKEESPQASPAPEDELEEEPEEAPRTRSRLSMQPMVVVSAGGDPENPTLTMNLFPSLDEAGPRNEGRKGALRTVIVQQRTSRNFTYHAQEYMAKVIGGRDRNGQPRRGQQLLVGLTGGAQSERSDPADFVWGARGLDSIISGLLESMSDRGPPPAKKDKVDALPTVEATQEIIDENADGCTICKDSFKVGDKLRRLPCKHLFHENCIIPWLKLHDTCPTCRYHVNTDKEKSDSEETP